MRSYSEKEMKDLRCNFEKIVLSWSHVTQKKTFGCPSYQANGKTFAILVTKGVLITKIDQAVKDTLPDQHQDGAIHTCKKNIEHWVRIPINDEAEIEFCYLFDICEVVAEGRERNSQRICNVYGV